MGRAPISSKKLSDSLVIGEIHKTGEHPQGFCIYDYRESYNIAYCKPTEEEAYTTAIEYYRKGRERYRKELEDLRGMVDRFLKDLGVEKNED